MSLINNLRKRGLKDLNWRKFKIYLRYLYYKIKGDSYPELFVPEYKEQIVHRMLSPGCRECIKAGECIHCGCISPQLFYDSTNECSQENWFAMYDPETWREVGTPVDPFYMDQLDRKGVITKFEK